MYEIERSKVYTPISILYNWNDTMISDFFSSIENIIKQKANENKKSEMKILNKLKKMMGYKMSAKVNTVSYISKQDYEVYEFFLKEVNNLIVD